METARAKLWTCSRCLRAQQRGNASRFIIPGASRSISTTLPRRTKAKAGIDNDTRSPSEEMGALSRKLSEMAEEAMDTGSKSDRRLVQEAGFSQDLKKQLEERIASSSSTSQNQQAFSQANMPSYAGKGTQATAASQAWTGTESVEDAALRMLDDAHKKLRDTSSSRRPPIPPKVNLRPKPKTKLSAADRLVNARDRTSIYAFSQQEDLTEEDRNKLRKEMKERFTPGARPMPTSIQGLASLANERIEDAIARGQFRNINRGKGVNVDRDHNANSPFLDTTEYFMNKIIQKQDIVPPWIEKQQELVKMTNSFRSRLRKDWRRHAARMIASSGGSLDDQVRRAKGYALAEEIANPRQDNLKTMKSISSDGSLASVTIEDRIAAGVIDELKEDLKDAGIEVEVKVQGESTPTAQPASSPSSTERVLPMPYPFRDEAYLAAESAYHNLAVAELNSFTRSYNLMAPKIAQKPYFTLERELKRCFAEVAPTIADEIIARHNAPKYVVGLNREKEGIIEKVLGEDRVWKGYEGKIRDEDETRSYGWKQFWRDIWKRDDKPPRQTNV
jgi:hypothetical protein